MPAKKNIAASTTILAGASVIRCVEGANNFNPVEKGESPTSPLGINSQVVQSEDERGKRGESVISDGRLITEEDLGILTPTLEQKMLRRKIQQQKKDARSKNKKPQRDPAMEWEDRTSASDVVWGEKDQAVRALGSVGAGSCMEVESCDWLEGTVGDGSCTAFLAVNVLPALSVMDRAWEVRAVITLRVRVNYSLMNGCSELFDSSCYQLKGEVGAGSCLGSNSCKGLIGNVGDGSCIDPDSCSGHFGNIPDDCPSVSDLLGGKCNPPSQLSTAPSSQPSATTSTAPSNKPSATTSTSPSSQPSATTSTAPSSQPSATTSTAPSSQPSTSPVSGQGPDLSRDLCNTLLDEIFDLFLFSNAKEEAIKILVCGVEN
eukprot:CAMPEP_0181128836 /NCGR_PEP_ID=MMETSP1071-20121207/28988_1 /TAXON_ID=35127 /ORGANISM="Thalassiosira sp., Strain NH16" /LENGTH=373 /DNA_ID=CAMNT_0023214757 /DNA_START=155 /DNA_END=1277 /DNA_ORIENTATION=+